MLENRNTILAVILSGLVLIAWQYFYNIPQMERQRVQQQAQTELQKKSAPASQPSNSASPAPQAGSAPANAPPTAANAPVVDRNTALAASARIKIETPTMIGSISLKGTRIDDLSLEKFRETVDPKSPPIVLFSPSSTASPYYSEFGWVPTEGSTVRLPDQNTVWQQENIGALTPSSPVVLKYDNGEGLTFRRTISVDDRYLFTVKDEVTNTGTAPVTLYHYALISRGGTPPVSGYSILHEGLIGYLGDKGLQELTYKNIDEKPYTFENVTDAWLGITDKYWAAALLPEPSQTLMRAGFSVGGQQKRYQADYMLPAQTINIGGTAAARGASLQAPRKSTWSASISHWSGSAAITRSSASIISTS